MTIKAGHWPAFIVMTLFFVLFYFIIKNDYKNKYLVTVDWSQSKRGLL